VWVDGGEELPTPPYAEVEQVTKSGGWLWIEEELNRITGVGGRR